MTNPALLQSILEHPEDDAARLVYADWLEENGQFDRAELIRRQIAEPQRLHSDDWTRRWLVPSMGLERAPEGWQVEWQRGFVVAVKMPLVVWKAHGPTIVREHPVERVRLMDKEPFLADGCAGWSLLTSARAKWELPTWLFGLAGGKVKNKTKRYYPSSEEAQEGLSVACLKWTRTV